MKILICQISVFMQNLCFFFFFFFFFFLKNVAWLFPRDWGRGGGWGGGGGGGNFLYMV